MSEDFPGAPGSLEKVVQWNPSPRPGCACPRLSAGSPGVAPLPPPLVVFSTAVDACPHGLPAHIGGGSQDALAVLLVVKIRGAHISVLSGLEKAIGKNNPPHPQQHVFTACQSWQAPEPPGRQWGDQAVELAQSILSLFKPLHCRVQGTPGSEAGVSAGPQELAMSPTRGVGLRNVGRSAERQGQGCANNKEIPSINNPWLQIVGEW